MLKPIRNLLLCVLLFNLSCQEHREEVQTVPQLANKADAWVKIYNAIAGILDNDLQKETDWSATIADSLNIEAGLIRNLIRMATNYTADALNVEKVLYRYPHYQADSLVEDMDQLRLAGLLDETDTPETFSLSASGQEVLSQYWAYRTASADNSNLLDKADIQSLERVLSGLVIAAKSLEDGFNNNSILWRIDSRPEGFDELPAVIRLSEYRKEYTAFINDNAHYKYDNFLSQTPNPDWQQLSMAALAKELMSATRAGRTYDLNRCFNQSNWRVGKAGCERAVTELESLGFVSRTGDSIRQTDAGAALSVKVQEFADARLYSTWEQMDTNVYKTFIKILDELITEGKR